MDISPFYELRSRLYYAAAAGCASIGEDYRYKRAVEGFEPLSKANKAFGKLYGMCASLMESESPSSEIFDCIALAEALAVTQGVSSDSSEAEPLNETICAPADIPIFIINDIYEAIDKAASYLRWFPKNYAEYLLDPRIMYKFLDFMENGRETPDFRMFAETVCTKIIGKKIAPLLKASVKDSGKQIKYVAELCGAEENDWYLSLAENKENSESVRKEAAAALSLSESSAEKLTELYNTEKGKVKSEALLALARLSPKEAEPIFKNLCGKYKKGNVKYISESHGEECTKFAVKRLTELLELCKEREKDKKGFKETLDIFFDEWELLNNKTDESADDIIIALCENDKIALNAYNFTFLLSDMNKVLINGLKGKRAKETEEQIERLYAKKPEYFQTAKAFLDFIKNPMAKIKVSSRLYQLQNILINIDYMPLLEQYNIGWGPGNNEKLPLLTIGDHFPQSVIDFFDETSNELMDEFEKLQNGLPNNFEDLAQKTGLYETGFLDKRKYSRNLQVLVLEHYLRGILFLYENILTIGNCAAGDSDRIKKAAVPLAVRSTKFTPMNVYARNIILAYYEGSDEELIKLNTTYALNSLKYNGIIFDIPLVKKKSSEVIEAALDDLEKELPTVEGSVDKDRVKRFRDHIKASRQYYAKSKG